MRVFVAVDPGESVTRAAERAIEKARERAPTARFAHADGLHVTLAFLGDVDDALVPALEGAMRDVAAAHSPLGLAFDGAGTFGASRHPRVLWAGVTGETARLGAIQAELAAALAPLGYVAEERAYHPHLTLGRSREPRGDAALADAAAALAEAHLGAATCDALVLYRSDLGPGGARYTAIARAPLLGR